MSRNLTADIQGVVANPSVTKLSNVWFGAFGGSYSNAAYGEVAWVDDVALNFNGVPLAVFTSSPASGNAPLTVSFDGSWSHESEGFSGVVIEYLWDFGDGHTANNVSGPLTTHTYSRSGLFIVKLTVVDSYGSASSPFTAAINVSPAAASITSIAFLAGVLGLVGGLLFISVKRRSSRKRRASLRGRRV